MSKDRFVDPSRKPRPKSAFISRLKYLTLKLIIAAGTAVMSGFSDGEPPLRHLMSAGRERTVEGGVAYGQRTIVTYNDKYAVERF
ncbi:hypothetical protein PhaeoP54_01641 [Phaeobacter inhibens]|nr:hypothetical protein PhaeoP54_01641 [Phaeobacter inhibens]AUQ78368.1 hypothetical protein PhaeoP74_01674 [Phaeobacter inhibens]AUR15527.1 hypothetical protein PhaeoP70_01672 [Phaeobacter inhibens]